jgi:uncharacterized membrane protein HdeD (DUF308 family)
MLRDLARAWWLVHIRGVLTVLFGAFLIFLAGSMQGQLTTAIALVGVLLIFVFYLVGSGLLSIATGCLTAGGHHRWSAVLLHGTILVTLGISLFFSNQLSLMWLVWFTVANAFGSGLLELMLAHTVRRHVDAWILTISGAASLIIALVLILVRNAVPSGIVLTLGIYAIFYGALLVLFSLRLHGIKQLGLAFLA